MLIGGSSLDSLRGVFGKILTFSCSRVFHAVQAKLLKFPTVGPNSVSCSNKVTKVDLQPKISPSSLCENWIYLKIDGVAKVHIGFAIAGRVLQDRSERWIIDCNKYLIICSATEVELWSIKDGGMIVF